MDSFEKMLKQILNSRSIEPDDSWIEQTRRSLEDALAKKNVTLIYKKRKPSIVTLFYLLNFYNMNKSLKLAMVSILAIAMVLSAGFVLRNKADASAPGDVLYSLDLLYERFERLITINSGSRIELELELLEERKQELEELTSKDAEIDTILSLIDRIVQQEEKAKQILEDYQQDLEDTTQAKFEEQFTSKVNDTHMTLKEIENMYEDKDEVAEKVKEHEENMQKLGVTQLQDDFNNDSDNSEGENEDNVNEENHHMDDAEMELQNMMESQNGSQYQGSYSDEDNDHRNEGNENNDGDEDNDVHKNDDDNKENNHKEEKENDNDREKDMDD